jgi:hypothetical protein
MAARFSLVIAVREQREDIAGETVKLIVLEASLGFDASLALADGHRAVGNRPFRRRLVPDRNPLILILAEQHNRIRGRGRTRRTWSHNRGTRLDPLIVSPESDLGKAGSRQRSVPRPRRFGQHSK